MKTLLDFNAKVGREDIFKLQTVRVLRVVNFTTSPNLIVKSTTFLYHNIHKFTWTSPDAKTHNQIN
jgi:hypothetical protein